MIVFPKNTTQWPRPDLEPRPLDPKSSIETSMAQNGMGKYISVPKVGNNFSGKSESVNKPRWDLKRGQLFPRDVDKSTTSLVLQKTKEDIKSCNSEALRRYPSTNYGIMERSLRVFMKQIILTCRSTSQCFSHFKNCNWDNRISVLRICQLDWKLFLSSSAYVLL